MVVNGLRIMSEDEFAKRLPQWLLNDVQYDISNDKYVNYNVKADKDTDVLSCNHARGIYKTKKDKNKFLHKDCHSNPKGYMFKWDEDSTYVLLESKQINGNDQFTVGRFKKYVKVCIKHKLLQSFAHLDNDPKRLHVFYKYLCKLVESIVSSRSRTYKKFRVSGDLVPFFESSHNQRALLLTLDTRGLDVIAGSTHKYLNDNQVSHWAKGTTEFELKDIRKSLNYESRLTISPVHRVGLNYNLVASDTCDERNINLLLRSLCVGFVNYFTNCLCRGIEKYYQHRIKFKNKSKFLIDNDYFQHHVDDYVRDYSDSSKALPVIAFNDKLYGLQRMDSPKTSWVDECIASINTLVNDYYNDVFRTLLNTDYISADQSNHQVDRDFDDYMVNVCNAGALKDTTDENIVFSLVHLFYIITRSDSFLEEWLSGEAYSGSYTDNLIYYINHLVLNPNLKYNYQHKVYGESDLLKRVFGVYLQVEMLVLDDSVISDKLMPSLHNVLHNVHKIRMLEYHANNDDRQSLLQWVLSCKSKPSALRDTNLVRICLDTQASSYLYQAVNATDSQDNMKGMRRDIDAKYDEHYGYIVNGNQVLSEVYVSYKCLDGLAEFLNEIKRRSNSASIIDANKWYKHLHSRCLRKARSGDFYYTDDRKQAVKVITHHNVSILTGVAGAGKTHVLGEVVSSFVSEYHKQHPDSDREPLSICGASLTGQAVTQLAGSISKDITKPSDISAIHCFPIAGWETHYKELDNYRFQASFNPNITLSEDAQSLHDCRLLLVDEFSLVDEESLIALIKRVPQTCRIILIGDSEQLPTFTGTPFVPEIERLSSKYDGDYDDASIFSSVGYVKLTASVRNKGRIGQLASMLRFDNESNRDISEDTYTDKLLSVLRPNDETSDQSIDYVSNMPGFKLRNEIKDQFMSDARLLDFNATKMCDMGIVVGSNADRVLLNRDISNKLHRHFITKSDVYKYHPVVNGTTEQFYIAIQANPHRADDSDDGNNMNDDATYCFMKHDRVVLSSKLAVGDELSAAKSGDNEFIYTFHQGSSMPKPMIHTYTETLPNNTAFVVRNIRCGKTSYVDKMTGSNDSANGKRHNVKYTLVKNTSIRAYKPNVCEDLILELEFVGYPDSYITVKGKSLCYLASKLDLAYAFTAHKSQGATYKQLYCLIPYVDINKPNDFVTCNLIYTTISRASKKLFIRAYNDKWIHWCYQDQSYAYHDAQLLVELFESSDRDVKRLQSSSNQ